MRHPRPPRRRAHTAGGRERLEKGHLPLDHELGLRGAVVLCVEVGVEDDWVGYGSVGGGLHRFALLVRKGTGLVIHWGAFRTDQPSHLILGYKAAAILAACAFEPLVLTR